MSEWKTTRLFHKQTAHAVEVLRDEGFSALISKALETPRIIARSIRCRRRLQKIKLNPNVDQRIDFVFREEYIAPLQIRSEMTKMLEVIRKAGPKVVVEIGTAKGGTLCLLCSVAHENATIISIDLPGGKYGSGYSAWSIPLYEAFPNPSQTLHLLRGDSHSDEMLGKLRSILSGREIDFLFIDGDHTAQGVRRDFELYSSLVARDGMIGFHDISPVSPSEDYGTRKLWDELKHTFRWTEIIDDPTRAGFGIGLIHK